MEYERQREDALIKKYQLEERERRRRDEMIYKHQLKRQIQYEQEMAKKQRNYEKLVRSQQIADFKRQTQMQK